MAKYLKKFNSHSDYEAAESNLILPNVSLCVTEADIHYNPYVEPPETRVVAKFNVTDTSNPTLIGYTNYMSCYADVEIDGVEQQYNLSAYTFSTTGEHVVKYTLRDATSVNEDMFWGCENVTSITLPNSVTSIGQYAFRQCSSLTTINIPTSVTSIGEGAFLSASSITALEIPNGVTTIGNSTFANCTSLTSVNIPNGVTSIGQRAFDYCGSLTSIVIPDGVTSVADYTFRGCSGLTSCTIGNGVTSIGAYSLLNCSSLTTITIPSGVTYISMGGFYNCSGLTSITVNATTPPSMGTSVFNNTNNCPIYVPSGSVDAYKAKTRWTEYASRIQAIS